MTREKGEKITRKKKSKIPPKLFRYFRSKKRDVTKNLNLDPEAITSSVNLSTKKNWWKEIFLSRNHLKCPAIKEKRRKPIKVN